MISITELFFLLNHYYPEAAQLSSSISISSILQEMYEHLLVSRPLVSTPISLIQVELTRGFPSDQMHNTDTYNTYTENTNIN